jgi:hypothetical protein
MSAHRQQPQWLVNEFNVELWTQSEMWFQLYDVGTGNLRGVYVADFGAGRGYYKRISASVFTQCSEADLRRIHACWKRALRYPFPKKAGQKHSTNRVVRLRIQMERVLQNTAKSLREAQLKPLARQTA